MSVGRPNGSMMTLAGRKYVGLVNDGQRLAALSDVADMSVAGTVAEGEPLTIREKPDVFVTDFRLSDCAWPCESPRGWPTKVPIALM